ncbi:methylmalonyl Co-A mutase-associated GTPase MeaB [Natronorubrum aibiense]|uniref:Methylmalonyl Co-A mutase-associated GTPase MeaB n=1 Tax=Natronorubrum aibiense TaxID=348826 RepID=A0A5P9PAY6_9EURY|nr:methylmalonyl Co-A mutase-associated GTPase MeaB [Natronorubrum aibiense]QFU84900.1 methylmalonyl Co-A mutase-associated GTPase MeaB [Natronorubrum aibiense]
MTADTDRLLEDLLEGDHRALARVITKIENRSPGYRELVSALHTHTGSADVIGITGSPGAGKSTLVDKIAKTYRDRGQTVGVIAIDPSSPFSGGSVLGDRIRMASTVGDMDVFFRSMSARGSLGGLSTATTDAVRALDAFGKDKIIIETVGAGQNEVDIVKTADTVAVLVPPGGGDDIQMLKAGILEIADVFVVNKADMDGADMTVKELREMVTMDDPTPLAGHHGPDETASFGESDDATADSAAETWTPPIIETIATSGEGVADFLDTIDDHVTWLEDTGERAAQERTRYADEIRTLFREDTSALLEAELEARGGLDTYVDSVVDAETDPYTVAAEFLEPLEACLQEQSLASEPNESTVKRAE